MSGTRYVLTKYERMLRLEKVEYVVEIPDNVRNKLIYADKQIMDSNYTDCKVVDIPVSKMLDEEIHGLRRVKHKK